jgi:hypothetical protein
MEPLAIALGNQKTVAKWLVIKIQSSPKCKARKKFRRAAYDLYVSKKFFMQRSSWDEIMNFERFPSD